MISPRFGCGRSRHLGNAALAEATAALTSSMPDIRYQLTSSPLPGSLRTYFFASLALGFCHFPLIRFRTCSLMAASGLNADIDTARAPAAQARGLVRLWILGNL